MSDVIVLIVSGLVGIATLIVSKWRCRYVTTYDANGLETHVSACGFTDQVLVPENTNTPAITLILTLIYELGDVETIRHLTSTPSTQQDLHGSLPAAICSHYSHGSLDDILCASHAF